MTSILAQMGGDARRTGGLTFSARDRERTAPAGMS